MKSLFYVSLLTVFSFGMQAQNSQCSEFSNSFQSFINSLKKDNYKTISSNEDLTLETSGKNNKLEFKDLKGFSAKCNKVLKDGMYVRFKAYEICFSDIQKAKEYEAKIIKIIDGSDLKNEKIYDFIIRADNKLIYISTDARIFYESVLKIKNKLEKNIKNLKP